MKTNLNSIAELKKEFQDMQVEFSSIHASMRHYLDGYEHNFFYKAKPHMTQQRIGVNFVQLFMDKLWFHTSEFPKINVPKDPNDNGDPEKREKILMATHQKNGTENLWHDWTFDGGAMGMCAASVIFDVKKRCNIITRYDPRRCYWQKSDSNNEEVEVFWVAIPRTASAIKRRYGVEPTGSDGLIYDMLGDGELMPLDTEDYYLDVTRFDGETITQWAGNKWIKKPYKHLQGTIPIEVAMPYKIANYDLSPSFYIGKLEKLQAEFNELWRRRANVVRKLGNPLVYGRGVYKQNEQDVKNQLASDGGFVPLKENGELALLTIPETKMIDTALEDCFQRMKDISGFPTSTFGEVAGANTSGDALGMYFTPTQKMINHFNIGYKSFLRGINARILRNYNEFGKIGEKFSLQGYTPQGVMRQIEMGNGKKEYRSTKNSGYSLDFTKDDIAHNYISIVTPAAVTPKDDVGYKRFILDSVTNKFISRATGLDEIGILSPEDEFNRLMEEQSSPYLNPQTTDVLLKNQQGQLEDTDQAPTGAPVEDILPQNPIEV